MQELKSKAWRDDRNWLRKELSNKPFGLYATFLCALVSHMRGKLHMASYKLKSAGWRSVHTLKSPYTVFPEKQKALLTRMYGEYALNFYINASIEDLEAQAEWIRHYGASFERRYDSCTREWVRSSVIWNDTAREIAGRVLDPDKFYAVKEAVPASEVQEVLTQTA